MLSLPEVLCDFTVVLTWLPCSPAPLAFPNLGVMLQDGGTSW